MNGAARMSLEVSEVSVRNAAFKETNAEIPKLRVHVFGGETEWQERLLHKIENESGFEAIQEQLSENAGPKAFAGVPVDGRAEILVMFSSGTVTEDLRLVRQARKKTPGMKVMLVGSSEKEKDFLQYVRGGINGFRTGNASAEEILAAARAVCNGKAICGSTQCEFLFRYLERENGGIPSAAMRRDIGFTRREQQLVPLLTKGMTNKEIANHFSLSEQTVKNHLYRMKRKSGAGDRLEIVDICRQRGFLA